jgi:hypothetical protein
VEGGLLVGPIAAAEVFFGLPGIADKCVIRRGILVTSPKKK